MKKDVYNIDIPRLFKKFVIPVIIFNGAMGGVGRTRRKCGGFVKDIFDKNVSYLEMDSAPFCDVLCLILKLRNMAF